MKHNRYAFLAATLAVVALALIAAGCGSMGQPAATSVGPSPTAQAEATVTTLPDTSTSTPLPTATPPPVPTATPQPQPTDSPTRPPEPTDTPEKGPTPTAAEAESTTSSGFTSRVDPSEIITVLPKDAISAILNPQFVTVDQANAQMQDHEFVIGVSINGQSRAYPINMLSSHEIVNDEVGGVAIAVTW